MQPQGAEGFCGKQKDLHRSVYMYEMVARAYQYNIKTEAITECVKLNLWFPMDDCNVLTTLTESIKSKLLSETPTRIADEKKMKAVLAESVKKYTKRVQDYEDSCCNDITTVYGQCSYSLQTKVRGQIK